ncbi:PPE family protein [Mycobacterium sp. TY815]|uniref:PPE family protein n=1 Tax=Mycobacterium sp. TY815 TaxID=3050581 RepID=UPI002740930F|nr:PPE family protein [Mycobacterium sp. TY815]MDP7701981.1 PPE family protein [Mycobacterium sp. TY815]
MTAALDFAALPPEINSARMYTGPGSGPMLAAASAWNGLAAELRATALSYDAVLSALIGEEWFGPASASMAAAAMPHVAWMSATAAQAEQTAAQAEAAASAFEAAYAATVPPALITANRAQLAALVATNILGQNSPAIAATEAQYLQMWAQDAAAMYGYAGYSAVATQLSPFVGPDEIANPSGLTAQAVAVNQAGGASAAGQQGTVSQLFSAVPNALQGLSGSNSGQGLSEITNFLLTGNGPANWQDFMTTWGPNANIWNTITSTGTLTPGATVGTLSSLFGAPAMTDVAGAAQEVLPGALGSTATGSLESGGGLQGLAAVGNSGVVGKLSVPPAWTSAAPVTSPLHSALGGTPMVAPPPAGTPGMPGVPLGNVAAQPYGRAVPQYGFRPIVVMRPPAAG